MSEGVRGLMMTATPSSGKLWEELISSGGDVRQVHQICAPRVDRNWWGGSRREVRQLPQRDRTRWLSVLHCFIYSVNVY